MDIEKLAMFRVQGKNNIHRMERDFTPEEITERRFYMRKVLKATEFSNRSDNDLDNMRICADKNGNGYFVEDTNGYEYFLQDKKIDEQECEFRRIRAMMPPEYMNLTGKDFDWTKYVSDTSRIKNIVQKFIVNYESFQDKNMGLYIFSKIKGSGKTMLSCCILNEISRRYIGSVKFINALDLLEMTKKGFDHTSQEVDALYMAKVLVIDDIGVQLNKEWVDTVFYRLINSRYQNKKTTIYTSNLPINKLKMDERIIDRIDATSFEIHLPETSIRQQVRRIEKEKIINSI